MKLVEFTITSPMPYDNESDFNTAYFDMFAIDDYNILCSRLQSEGKLVYRSWSLTSPTTYQGVYLFTDQSAINEYWADPVNDNPSYDSAMAAAGWSLNTSTSAV